MSLWTPGGEHPVEREPHPQPQARADTAGGQIPGLDDLDDLSPEERAQAEAMAAEMADVRRQLAEVPAAVVVTNHLMGFYELAAIHLSQQPPALAEARLAIDAMAAVADKLAGRLGENEATLRDALHQLRLAFVQLSGGSAAPAGAE